MIFAIFPLILLIAIIVIGPIKKVPPSPIRRPEDGTALEK